MGCVSTPCRNYMLSDALSAVCSTCRPRVIELQSGCAHIEYAIHLCLLAHFLTRGLDCCVRCKNVSLSLVE